jgi:hypothetical protein
MRTATQIWTFEDVPLLGAELFFLGQSQANLEDVQRISQLTQVWNFLGLPVMGEILKNTVQKVRCVNL